MDSRVLDILAALKAAGYTDKYVPDHWGGGWRDKRWFGLAAPDSSILEIVTANVYTRILLVGGANARPFACVQFVSTAYVERPKTDYHLYDQVPVRKSVGEIMEMILPTQPVMQEEAA